MKSLQDITQKINPFSSVFGLVSLLMLAISIGSFAIGRWSVLTQPSQPEPTIRGVIIDNSASELYFNQEEERTKAPKTIMASIHGTRFYPADCRAGQNIKEENRIWFTNENEAKMAGYSLAKSCQ